MTRYIVPALAVLALCAPVAARAQSVAAGTGPVDIRSYPQGADAQAPPFAYDAAYYGYGAAYPPPMPSAPPGTVWVRGHYDWDPGRQTYVWIDGQYVRAPHQNAQWVAGHWMQTPTAWIWVDGRWN